MSGIKVKKKELTKEEQAIVDFLRTQDGGRLLTEMHKGIIDCTHAIRAAGKTATMTLKISVAPDNHPGIQTSCALDVKLPKPKGRTSTSYVSDDNEITREHPDQAKLPGMEDEEESSE